MFGTGGDDSKIFCDELLDAYSKYAKNLKLETVLLQNSFGHKILQVSGPNAVKAFENETGGHTVQRVSPTEAKGRRHTSIVSVAVLPLPPEKDEKSLNSNDLDITFQTGRQKSGGQNVNKVASACRCVHKPSGLSVFINGRDQHSNKRDAIRILTVRVNQQKNDKQEQDYGRIRKEHLGNGNRGEKRRTYCFIDSRVTDHILGTKTSNIKEVMKGNFKLLWK